MNLKADGSEDDLIHCFKNDQPCAPGSAVLKDQMKLLKDADFLDINPFQTSTNSDIEEANIEDNLIDVDDLDDDFIDIEDLKILIFQITAFLFLTPLSNKRPPPKI